MSVETHIDKGECDAAERILKVFCENAEKLLLSGEILLERARYVDNNGALVSEAYARLVRAFCHKSMASLSGVRRQLLVSTLLRAAKTADPVLAALLEADHSVPGDGRVHDVLKAFYFEGACKGFAPGERALKAKESRGEEYWPGKTIQGHEFFIEFHKVFSSYTPLLDPSKVSSLGGGYFLALGGYGCVVDPGHHFLDNFLSKRSVDDIHGIVVTHFHDDHYADLPALLSLLYQRCRNTDRKLDLFVDRTTASMFRRVVREAGYIRKFEILSANSGPWQIYCRARLRCLPTLHLFCPEKQNPANPAVFNDLNTGVGLVWDIPEKETRVVITGDTGWTSELRPLYRSLRGPRVVLVAHVSTACREEALGGVLREEPGYYPKHLGIRGLCRVIESLQPACVILSEIGEELGDVIERLASLVESAYPCACRVGWHGYQELLPVDPVSWPPEVSV